jgi:SAM-dependent methyltransferase
MATRSTPLPPPDLITRVFGVGVEGWTDPARAYEVLGAQTKDAVVRQLPDDWSWEGRRVLDFGCGAGRTLRHFLAEAEVAEIWGADIDAPSVTWLAEHLSPPLHAWQTPAAPPSGLEHGSFDLIYAVSVFTHLTDESLPWLRELHALLKPGGLLIASYMGRWTSEFLAGEPWVEDQIGMNAVRHEAGWEVGGPLVLMSDWWVRAHWGRAFDIVDIEPQIHNMSWAVMRRREVELTTADLEQPADDPREHAALRHQVRQLRHGFVQERAALDARHAAAIEAVRRGYEESLSWQLTAPLRAVARAARRRG